MSATNNTTLQVTPEVAPAWEMVLIGTLTIIAILANFTVICAFLIDRRVRTAFNYYLFNLACADFIVATMGMTNYAVYTYYNYWPLGYRACTVWFYFDGLGSCLTLQTIALIAFDRLWAVTLPISYKRYHTYKKSWIAIGFIWVVSHVLLVPSLAYYRVYIGIYEDPNDCYWDSQLTPRFASPFHIIAALMWTPTVLAVLAYFATTCQIYRRGLFHGRVQKQEGSQGTSANRDIQRIKKERQIYLLLSLLCCALIVMVAPYFCYQALSMSTGYNNLSFVTITYWMVYCLSAINPFLFNLACPEMKNAIKRLMGCFGMTSLRMNTVVPTGSTDKQHGLELVSRPISTLKQTH